MKSLLLVTLIFLSSLAGANSPSVLEESIYLKYKQAIFLKSRTELPLSPFEQSLFVDALTDLAQENGFDARSLTKNLNSFHFELVEKLRLALLDGQFSEELIAELKNALQQPQVELKLIYILSGHEHELIEAGLEDLIQLARLNPKYFDAYTNGTVYDNAILKDLFHSSPAFDGVKIFMFCRHNRLFPCLMVMRNINDEIVRKDDGSLWTNKALAASARGLPSHVRNGHTPAGVLLINSVMPHANETISFGKFRRMILDFIPSSQDEETIKSHLPESSHAQNWWRPNVVARDVGRNMLRIHGTGKINTNPESTFYPFMRTSGCIAQRENTYADVTYKDQRDLLDSVMLSLNLEPKYENETHIKGILYLVEINNEQRTVELNDLEAMGIISNQ